MTDTDPEVVPGRASGDPYLAALVALLADQREHDKERVMHRKTELLLADAGLTPSQIASLLGKKTDAVRKAVSRARAVSTGRAGANSGVSENSDA